MSEQLEHRVNRVLESVLMGVPVADHFLTLPNGLTLTIPDGGDPGEVFQAHALAAISEGRCPWCDSELNGQRECSDERHRPCRWHVCATGWGQVFLNVGRRPRESRCVECDQEM
jgi:hypothetical protein